MRCYVQLILLRRPTFRRTMGSYVYGSNEFPNPGATGSNPVGRATSPGYAVVSSPAIRRLKRVVRIISRMRGWISVRQRVPLNTP
jgi:hypothetical protein